MMNNVTLLLLLLTSSLFSQKIIFKGKLLDKNTQKPVVYANISFLKKNIGISTIENGTFSLEIDKNLLNKQIHISCLNYKDTVVFAKQLHQKAIFLQAKSIKLDEVVISKTVDREFVVDTYKRRDLNSGFSGIKGFPWIVAKFFPYDENYEETPYLKEISIHLSKNKTQKNNAKFRLRFFSINKSNGNPLNDILTQALIVYVKKNSKKIKIDVAKFDIEFPKDGFFIGLEWLNVPSNFFEVTFKDQKTKKKITQVRVAPTFKGIEAEGIKRTWAFSVGKWHQFTFLDSRLSNSTIVPAISLTLSN